MVFLWWCGGFCGSVVVFLCWCFCGVFVVFVWWCFCVVVPLWQLLRQYPDAALPQCRDIAPLRLVCLGVL